MVFIYNKSKAMITCCNDGTRPVIFKIERTVALMDVYLEQNGYVNDINRERLHHEIYMSDARRVAPERWKTVIRHPIKKA